MYFFAPKFMPFSGSKSHFYVLINGIGKIQWKNPNYCAIITLEYFPIHSEPSWKGTDIL